MGAEVSGKGNNCKKEVCFTTNKEYILPKKWSVLADNKTANDKKLYDVCSNKYTLQAFSAVVLVSEQKMEDRR